MKKCWLIIEETAEGLFKFRVSSTEHENLLMVKGLDMNDGEYMLAAAMAYISENFLQVPEPDPAPEGAN